MYSSTGRAPWPERGDPNAKTMLLALTAEEWRKLRARAAEDDTSVEQVIAQILRRGLERDPRRGF